MGVRFPSVASNTILNSPIITSAQTIICTTPPINEPVDNAQVLLWWWYNVTLGTTVTSITVRIHRGTATSGQVINVVSAFTATASTGVALSGCYFDFPGIVAGLQYSLDFQQNGAGSNATVNDVCMIAMVL